MITWIKEHARWVALAALILINAVLLILLLVRQAAYWAVPAPGPTWSGAVRQSSPGASPPSGTPTPSTTPAPSSTPTPSATATPEKPPASSSRAVSGPRRLMAANSGRIAWRAEEGTCSKRAMVEVTTDGGQTWRKTDPGIRGIVRLSAYGDKSLFAVGADKDCKPTYAWVDSPGGTWHRNPSVIWDVWFRYPSDKDLVHAPGGRKSRPCGDDLVALAGGSSRAAALCGDGRIRTVTAGRGWQTVLTKSGALAVNADDSSFVVAQPNSACDRLVAHRFRADGDGLRSTAVCRPVVQAAVAVRGSVTWTWRDGSTRVS